MSKRSHRALPGGFSGLQSFSIVELLVAMAILFILMAVLLGLLTSLTTAWQAGQAHNERRTIAQAVFDRMSRDLSQAVVPLSPGVTNTLQLVIDSSTANPSGIGAAYEYPQAIFCQAPVATDGGANGNLAVVGYFVQWVTNTVGTPAMPCLSRVLINPSSPDYAVYSGLPNNATNWINNTLLTKYAPAKFFNPSATTNYAGLLAPNVIGLWVQAVDPTPTGSSQLAYPIQGTPIQQGVYPALNGEAFDSRYSYAYLNHDNSSAGVLTTNLASALPASLQIAIVIVDSRTAKQLPNQCVGAWGTGGIPKYPALSGNFWNDVQNFYNGLPLVIRKGAEIQTTTIPLANGPR